MKPPFMLLKSTSSPIPDSLKRNKKSGLHNFGDLQDIYNNGTQSPRQFVAPKPPKKRYLEENYSQNKVLENNCGIILNNNNNSNTLDKDEIKRTNINDQRLFPDVNPILPDVVPKNDCKDVESRKSWRKKLLCWEKLEEFDSLSSCDRLKPDIECLSNQRDEVQKTEKSKNHCPKENNSTSRPGRRGSARACKGQKYREFMWTNVIHQRRKSSRWELCQDSVDSSAMCERDVNLPDNSKTDHFVNNYIEKSLVSRSSTGGAQVNSVDIFYKKKKIRNKSIDDHSGRNADTCKPKIKTCDSPSPRKKLLKRDNKISVKRPLELNDSEPNLIGSKKRKLRRQSIRRLEPGSDFKDTRVVEDARNSNATSVTSGKMKLRK